MPFHVGSPRIPTSHLDATSTPASHLVQACGPPGLENEAQSHVKTQASSSSDIIAFHAPRNPPPDLFCRPRKKGDFLSLFLFFNFLYLSCSPLALSFLHPLDPLRSWNFCLVKSCRLEAVYTEHLLHFCTSNRSSTRKLTIWQFTATPVLPIRFETR